MGLLDTPLLTGPRAVASRLPRGTILGARLEIRSGKLFLKRITALGVSCPGPCLPWVPCRGGNVLQLLPPPRTPAGGLKEQHSLPPAVTPAR